MELDETCVKESKNQVAIKAQEYRVAAENLISQEDVRYREDDDGNVVTTIVGESAHRLWVEFYKAAGIDAKPPTCPWIFTQKPTPPEELNINIQPLCL